MRRLHPCLLRFGNQQHGVFGNIISLRHTRIRSNHRSRVKLIVKGSVSG
jgi:hypothetical protein